MNKEIEQIIRHLDLSPHPEGGFYRETYRSEHILGSPCLPAEMNGERNYATSIYFLLTSEAFSAFHRIKQDETWHFYAGSPIEIHMIDQSGVYDKIELGLDFSRDILPQYTMRAHTWFAASVAKGGSYGLAGCTVSPGFDFRDFEMADRHKLLKEYPVFMDVIKRFTR